MSLHITACTACGAPIFWLRNRETGRPAPIDAEPSEGGGGNCLVFADGTYHVLHKGETVELFGEAHTSHFQTCPQADRFRKRRGEVR